MKAGIKPSLVIATTLSLPQISFGFTACDMNLGLVNAPPVISEAPASPTLYASVVQAYEAYLQHLANGQSPNTFYDPAVKRVTDWLKEKMKGEESLPEPKVSTGPFGFMTPQARPKVKDFFASMLKRDLERLPDEPTFQQMTKVVGDFLKLSRSGGDRAERRLNQEYWDYFKKNANTEDGLFSVIVPQQKIEQEDFVNISHLPIFFMGLHDTAQEGDHPGLLETPAQFFNHDMGHARTAWAMWRNLEKLRQRYPDNSEFVQALRREIAQRYRCVCNIYQSLDLANRSRFAANWFWLTHEQLVPTMMNSKSQIVLAISEDVGHRDGRRDMSGMLTAVNALDEECYTQDDREREKSKMPLPYPHGQTVLARGIAHCESREPSVVPGGQLNDLNDVVLSSQSTHPVTSAWAQVGSTLQGVLDGNSKVELTTYALAPAVAVTLGKLMRDALLIAPNAYLRVAGAEGLFLWGAIKQFPQVLASAGGIKRFYVPSHTKYSLEEVKTFARLDAAHREQRCQKDEDFCVYVMQVESAISAVIHANDKSA